VTCPEEITDYLTAARHAVRAAQVILDQGLPGEAASRAYYAMFYAAQALLRSVDVVVKRHSAVEAALGEHFAKTRRLDPKLHRMFMQAREAREIADYVVVQATSPEKASQEVADAAEFLAAVERFLEREEGKGGPPTMGR
jgi:uncharacterized protein (UPF0332 family)